MSLLSLEEALGRLLRHVPLPQPETVPLYEAHGRVLFRPVLARRDQPPFPASSMDGYAVRAADTVAGQALQVIGTSQAGRGYIGRLEPRTAVRIFTGAPVPEGADCVIMQENASADGALVQFTKPGERGQNIRPAGNDFCAGQVVLEAGTRLGPGQILLAAAANASSLEVSRRPRAAILTTGDELVPPGGNPGPDQIVASNSAGLRALLLPYCSSFIDLGIVPDQPDAIAERLTAVLDEGVDIVVTSGGASVGDHDYLREVLLRLGVTLDFWKVAIRPGKPLMIGTRGQTLVFGLPGNPVSAMVTAEIFLKAALRRWLGYTWEKANLRLPLLAPLLANGERRHYLRGRVETSGSTGVRPIRETDSGHASSFAGADVLIVQPEHDRGMETGTPVEVVLLDAF